MKHLGDITKINGAEIPIVDVVTGGSPCQDLSVAGKRAGLEGQRSGLFMDQLRVIKEMREHDRRLGGDKHLCRPRYMVWENVVGALSSGTPKGEDFRIVLEETARVADKNASIPRPAKWTTSGCILGDGWSIAWRVHDAQFWGVAQRRRRIALVADFGGLTAPEILFERKGLQWNPDESGETRKGPAGDPEERTRGTGGTETNLVLSIENHAADSRVKIIEDETTQTLGARMGTGGNNVPLMMSWDGSQTAPTLTANNANGAQRMPDKDNFNAVLSVDLYNQSATEGPTKSLNSAATDSDHVPCVSSGHILRRLTPLEAERLQGLPDQWTDIGEWVDSKGRTRQTTDSARYKALGNSIAVGFANEQRGFWMWLMKRISAQYERTATLGSLFDGISGFPLAWATYNGPENVLWSSEIEEFCIAVAKKHFGDEDTEGDIKKYL